MVDVADATYRQTRSNGGKEVNDEFETENWGNQKIAGGDEARKLALSFEHMKSIPIFPSQVHPQTHASEKNNVIKATGGPACSLPSDRWMAEASIPVVAEVLGSYRGHPQGGELSFQALEHLRVGLRFDLFG